MVIDLDDPNDPTDSVNVLPMSTWSFGDTPAPLRSLSTNF